MAAEHDRGGPDDLVEGFRSITASLMAASGSAQPGADSADPATQTPVTQTPVTQTPVTLLTGFLGSGKTTVLRHLLEADHGLRLTAVVNDLGSVNVDALSLGDIDGPRGTVDRLELANGCACCSLNDDLAEALSAAVSVESPPDAIVVEASGAADPVAMATTIEASTRHRLDGIVCVVDAELWLSRLEHSGLRRTALRQIEAAHLVLLAKTDLVSEETARMVVDSIANAAPGRRVLTMIDGAVDPAVLLGAAVLGAGFRPPSRPHDLTLLSETVAVPGRIDPTVLGAWLETDHRLLRAKGWLRGIDGYHYELQVVGRRWTLTRTAVEQSPAVVMISDDPSALNEAAAALGDGAGFAVASADS